MSSPGPSCSLSFPWPRRILPMAKGWAFLGSGSGPNADIDMGFPVLYPLTIAPQNPVVRLLGRRGGFWWRRAYITACQVLSFINTGVFSFAWNTVQIARHSFGSPTPCSCRFGTWGAPLIRSLHEATQLQWPKAALGIERDLSRLQFFMEICTDLNVARLGLHIRSTVGGHFLYVQTL